MVEAIQNPTLKPPKVYALGASHLARTVGDIAYVEVASVRVYGRREVRLLYLQ